MNFIKLKIIKEVFTIKKKYWLRKVFKLKKGYHRLMHFLTVLKKINNFRMFNFFFKIKKANIFNRIKVFL